jgi:hypothetical protein
MAMASILKAIVCAACSRRQEIEGPKALTLDECRIIGWAKEGTPAKEGTSWLCPLHAPGGKTKLEEVAKKGLSGR